MKKIKRIINYYYCKNLYMQIELIKKKIKNPKIKVISFDIFDTLLVRPSINPSDIFSVVSKDFALLRKNAEMYCTVTNYNIYDIWDEICDRNNICEEKKKQLIDTEIQLEKQMLYSRKVIYDLYKFAVSNQKRIIAISDMYLPESILNEILSCHGYKSIDKVYVSCDCKCSKSDGSIFEEVLKREGIEKQQVIHIGGNYYSDYSMPKNFGISSFYIPSNYHLFLALFSSQKDIFVDSDPCFRVVIGYAINKLFESEASKLSRIDWKKFSNILVFPLIAKIVYDFLNKKELKEYHSYYFVARDGYLPLLAYNAIKKASNNPAKYLYASRLSYSCLFEESIFDYSKKIKNFINIEQYLSITIADRSIFQTIISNLSDEDRKQVASYDNLKRILSSYGNILEEFFAKKKMICRSYFLNSINSKEERILVFDCGYSGSISNGISCALDNKTKVDKYYLYGNTANKEFDKNNMTKTFDVFTTDDFAKYCLFWETVLSSTEGTCIGYSEQELQPILRERNLNLTSIQIIQSIQKNVIESICSFNQLLGDYSDDFLINDTQQLLDEIKIIFSQNTKFANDLGKIVFDDDFLSCKFSLDNLIIDFSHRKTQLFRIKRYVKRKLNSFSKS